MKRLLATALMCLALTAAPVWAAGFEVTDMAGRKVLVPESPARVVALGPGALRLVCYLQAADKIVGVEEFESKRPHGRPYWYANQGLAKLPSVTAGGPGMINKLPDMERLLAVKPQLVFVTYMEAGKADALAQRIKVPVVVLSYGRFASFDKTVYKALRLMGRILGKKQRAEQVVEYIEAARADLNRRVQGLDQAARPSVYVGGVGYKGFQGMTSTDPQYVPTVWVDANNVAVATGQKGHVFVAKEQLLAWNPAVVFVDATGARLVAGEVKKSQKFYNGLEAFGQGRVFLLHPFVYYVANLGTAVASAYAAGKVLYPDRFQDVNPAAKADEVYSFMVGKPVYKPMAAYFGALGERPGFVR
jgi:iron complex transport system substrate-binding protein